MSTPSDGRTIARRTPVRSPRGDFDWRLEFCLLMDEVSRLQRIVAGRQMARFGLTHIQWLALTYILHHEGMTQTDLQDQLEITRGGCTQLVDRLVKSGLVERRSDPRDRRNNHLYLLPEAEHVLDTARGISEAMHARMFAHMSEEEGRLGITHLARLKECIVAIDDEQLGDADSPHTATTAATDIP